MIVICEECGKKYRIDPEKIKGDKARFKCRSCSHLITVDKQVKVGKAEVPPAPEPTPPAAAEEKPAATPDTPAAETAQADAETAAAAPSKPKRAEKRKKKSGMGLTAKVILLMLIVSLIPGGIYFALSFKQTNDRIFADNERFGKQIVEALATDVEGWVDKNIRVLKAVAEMPAIRSMNRYEQEVLLKIVQKQYPWMYLVFTTDGFGMNVARNDGKDLKDYSDRQYVQDVMAGKDIAWQNLIGKTSKKPALVLAVPIIRNEETVGVLAAAMTRDAISKRIATWRQGKTGYAFLVDENGKVIAHQIPAFVQKERDLSRNPLVTAANANQKGMIEFKGTGGKPEIGFANKTDLGWVIAIQQAQDEAFQSLKETQNFALILLGATFVAVVIIALLSSRAIVHPIRTLTDAANRISVGELGVEIQTKSKDEIGDLAEAITRMQDSIRLSIERLRRRRR
ncbi:MAG: cache domain-containing protein [Desulfobacterales bacterium]|nr:cache domain-containing protein [Desulfobacterales bacterium]MDJ0883029.1 cache domain-containing protein [Desulfobacterales bacterium]MDJ0887340.1 cache domain-containing protein [Desulfobacterales bacterium]MDJ0989288.1 cache domain-containing protein [Desulfobacterales bacterium]